MQNFDRFAKETADLPSLCTRPSDPTKANIHCAAALHYATRAGKDSASARHYCARAVTSVAWLSRSVEATRDPKNAQLSNSIANKTKPLYKP